MNEIRFDPISRFKFGNSDLIVKRILKGTAKQESPNLNLKNWI